MPANTSLVFSLSLILVGKGCIFSSSAALLTRARQQRVCLVQALTRTMSLVHVLEPETCLQPAAEQAPAVLPSFFGRVVDRGRLEETCAVVADDSEAECRNDDVVATSQRFSQQSRESRECTHQTGSRGGRYLLIVFFSPMGNPRNSPLKRRLSSILEKA